MMNNEYEDIADKKHEIKKNEPLRGQLVNIDDSFKVENQ